MAPKAKVWREDIRTMPCYQNVPFSFIMLFFFSRKLGLNAYLSLSFGQLI